MAACRQLGGHGWIQAWHYKVHSITRQWSTSNGSLKILSSNLQFSGCSRVVWSNNVDGHGGGTFGEIGTIVFFVEQCLTN